MVHSLVPVSKSQAALVNDGSVSLSSYTSYDRFPWWTPTLDKAQSGLNKLFPELITDAELDHRYERNPLVKVIIDDVPEDALRNGFFIYNVNDPTDQKLDTEFQKIYSTYIFRPFLKAIKMCRLRGHSFLYVHYKEGENMLLESPITELPGMVTMPNIEYLFPLDSNLVETTLTEYIPRRIQKIGVKFKDDESLAVHPDRFIHLENEGIGYDLMGKSVLAPVWDLLTIQDHAHWSIGQELWRGASGFLCVFAPKGATSADADAVLTALDNISSKTRAVFPPGWDAKDLAPSRISYDVRASYEVIIKQISAATRIPVSVLLPQVKDSSSSNYEQYLFTYQVSFITPVLEKIFTRFIKSGMLEDTPYEIRWFSQQGSPYEAAKTIYLKALSSRLQQTELENSASKTPGMYSISGSKNTGLQYSDVLKSGGYAKNESYNKTASTESATSTRVTEVPKTVPFKNKGPIATEMPLESTAASSTTSQ
jgi:hypothetical protein